MPRGVHAALSSSPIMTLTGPKTQLTQGSGSDSVPVTGLSLKKAGNFYFCDLWSLPFKKSSYPAGNNTWREIRPETVQ